MQNKTSHRGAVLVIALSCLFSYATAYEQQTQPARVVEEVDYGPAPESLEQLFALSPLVVRARIENSRVREAVPGAKRPSVVTDHRVTVLEVLKDDEKRLGERRQIQVLQHAGTLNVGGTVIVADPGSMPVFVSGQELVLFLRELDKLGGYEIVSGPSGAYVTDDETVRLPRAASRFREFSDRREVTKTEFLSTVRALRRR